MSDTEQPEIHVVDEGLREEIASLRAEVARLNTHRFVRIHNSVPRLLLFQLMRGMAFGLGTLVGATLLVSMLVYSLSSIDFIPVIGEWAAEIVDIITAKSPEN
ncbi:DUF5665 domain-containing protein [Halocynthiibacter sp.]|uniref:DUF5665 domain-containing protein n=1 Tax=Halocynthiibacter sp. TaxID=1979210 RepID=UPI003C5C6189